MSSDLVNAPSASGAADAAREVGAQATDQAKAVAGEAREQFGELLGKTQDELRGRAQEQSDRAAGALRTLAGQISALSEGRSEEAGPLTGYLQRGPGQGRAASPSGWPIAARRACSRISPASPVAGQPCSCSLRAVPGSPSGGSPDPASPPTRNPLSPHPAARHFRRRRPPPRRQRRRPGCRRRRRRCPLSVGAAQ